MGVILLRRFVTMVPTLACVILLSFFLMRFAPGGPFDGERVLDPEVRAALEARFGLDHSLGEQLAGYFASVLTGDFGPSLVYRDFTVSELVSQSLPLSLTLGGLAIALALVLGLALGTSAAMRENSPWDNAAMLFATLMTAMPTFVTGPLLALVFALGLGWLPVAGTGSVAHWVLPSLALALPYAGMIAKLVRSSLARNLKEEFVRTAYARGATMRAIMLRHALRPALTPVVSYLGPTAAGLLTGAIVIETVFGLPGLGRYFVQGALNRDYPLIMAVILVYAGLIILFNLIADLLLAWLDPRIGAE